MREGSEPETLERWYGDEHDLRFDEEVAYQISAFLREHQVLSVSMVDRIIGCPHEEVVDYPEGGACRTVHIGVVGTGSPVRSFSNFKRLMVKSIAQKRRT